jgi:hypothetical protein
MLADGFGAGWMEPGQAAESPLPGGEVDASYRLGELALDRASFAALGERPDMLSSILEAIEGALGASTDPRFLLGEDEDEEEAVTVYDA